MSEINKQRGKEERYGSDCTVLYEEQSTGASNSNRVGRGVEWGMYRHAFIQK